MGAQVIRVDQIGGGPDFRRWPLARSGASLYWEGLNKGKKSVALDLATAEARELLAALVTAPGERGGLFLTNFPVDGFLAHEPLSRRRPDLVTTRVMGQADGGPALDYTVNCAVGIPQMTGPASLGDEPVNHVLPAWDLMTGAYAAFALLAADRRRSATGIGGELRVPLADIGIASVANLGMLAEVLVGNGPRPRMGNDVFGAFGRDFRTRDGKRLMVMAITPRQWSGLVSVLGIGEAIAGIEASRRVAFASDEGARFTHRNALYPIVEAAIGGRDAQELSAAFDAAGCCWGPYQTLEEAASDALLVAANPMFAFLDHASGETYPAPGAMATVCGLERSPPTRAPHLGEHTDETLSTLLGLGSGSIGTLHDKGIIAQA